MPYKPLLDAWNESRVERTEMKPGRRVASMEYDLLPGDDGQPVDMSPGRRPGWFDLFAIFRSPDSEPEDDESEVQS